MTPADLLPLIGSTEDTARTIGDVAYLSAFPRREVEACVQEARLAGYPICSSSKGLWRAQDAQEAASMGERLRICAIHQLLTARAMRRSARRMAAAEAEQLPLFEEEAA